ncbi:MAG: type II secretion system GspH family protein [Betaproteobacteria bacterium]|nr:type II secretion system GspH family protein [Betaproteobacteria bacterium]
MSGRGRQAGFTYLALLFAVAVAGVALASTGALWFFELQREREAELLFVGNQFRLAIRSYYEQSPGMLKRYPMSLDELVKDNRYLGIKRHLRRVYADPVTGKSEWGLLMAPEGGIMGVHSLSDHTSIKRANFFLRDAMFEGKNRYSEWHFVYRP